MSQHPADADIEDRHYLKKDIVYTADGGGKARAALHPVSGVDSVSKVLIGLGHKAMRSIDPDPRAWTITLDNINGEPALLVWFHGALDSVMVLSFDADRISAIRVVRNPEKLRWLAAHT